MQTARRPETSPGSFLFGDVAGLLFFELVRHFAIKAVQKFVCSVVMFECTYVLRFLLTFLGRDFSVSVYFDSGALFHVRSFLS